MFKKMLGLLVLIFLQLLQKANAFENSCRTSCDNAQLDRVIDHECRLKRVEEILEKFVKIDYKWTLESVAPTKTVNPTTTARSPSECPKDWITYSSSCYFFSDYVYNFTKADGECSKYGAHLAHIESTEENTFITTKVKSLTHVDWWLGGTDIEHEGTWKWFRNGQLISFSDFWSGQPDNSGGSEHCLDIKSGWDFKWNDERCTHRTNFICEKEL